MKAWGGRERGGGGGGLMIGSMYNSKLFAGGVTTTKAIYRVSWSVIDNVMYSYVTAIYMSPLQVYIVSRN